MRRFALIVVAAMSGAIAAAIAVGVVTTGANAVNAAPVTPTSIAGAKLGLRPNVYKRRLGKPVRTEVLTQPDGWWRLVFTKRKVAVYFKAPSRRGVLITTWNKAYKTATGIGPCSTIEELKAAYGDRLKPSAPNTIDGKVYVYRVRNLLFAANGPPPNPSPTVTAVALYSPSLIGERALNFAGFIVLSQVSCT